MSVELSSSELRLDQHAAIVDASAPCVLIVEDDPLTQARLEILIESAGLAAVSVSTTEQARAALAAVFFPIVIVDRVLEDGDGIALCNEVRQQHPQGRVYLMLLSALDSTADIAQGIAAGADEYLSKRATDVEIVSRLTAARHIIALPPKQSA